MSSGWFLAVSALIFAIGGIGAVTRRNPLLTLVSLELMLNAANLALITFARMHNSTEGHVFALVVLVVAAAEVAVGLGLVVAMYRNRVAVDVDELREMRG